jgi:hypothetical protein
MPISVGIPADSRVSRIAADRNEDSMLRLGPSASCASASDPASAVAFSTARSLRLAKASSIVLAMKTVQVTSEAKARPIMTAFTTISADRNIDHGDNSLKPGVFAFKALGAVSAAETPGSRDC